MDAGTIISLHSLRSIHRVRIDGIVQVHYDSSICDVVLDNGTVILMAKSLNYFEEILPKSQFVRINRSDIVNLNHIIEIRSDGSRKKTCVLSNEKRLQVSYRRWPILKDQILLL